MVILTAIYDWFLCIVITAHFFLSVNRNETPLNPRIVLPRSRQFVKCANINLYETSDETGIKLRSFLF